MASHASSSVVAETERRGTRRAQALHRPARRPDQRFDASLPRRIGRSPRPCRFRWSRVWRNSRFPRSSSSNGRDLVQYRGCAHAAGLHRARCQTRRGEGTQPMLVFSDSRPLDGPRGRRDRRHRRSDRMNIEVGSDRAGHPGLRRHQGEAQPRSSTWATICPMAFEDWFMRKEMDDRGADQESRFCSSTTRSFFRNMLTPVLKAAGYDVTAVRHVRAPGSWTFWRTDRHVRHAIVSDIEMPEINGFEFCEALRRDPRFRKHAGSGAFGGGFACLHRTWPSGRASTTMWRSSTVRV